jgi:brefeldin A-inhibited guanine nucleotide-exchange protein
MAQQQTQSTATAEPQHALITRCLSKIIKECGRKQKILKEECTKVLEMLSKFSSPDKPVLVPYKDPLQADPNATTEKITEQWDTFANQISSVLRMACESKVSAIMEAALDCLEKLLGHGYIRGTTPFFEKPGEKLITVIIDCISNCFDAPDDNVQLQILKAFLTIVTTSSCDIHETNLMSSVRTCYNIYLVTKNQNNRNAAKGTLTQMLHAIFQRMDVLKGSKHAVPRSTNDTNESKQNVGSGSEMSQNSFDSLLPQSSATNSNVSESGDNTKNVSVEKLAISQSRSPSETKPQSEMIAENIVSEMVDEVIKKSPPPPSSEPTPQSVQSSPQFSMSPQFSTSALKEIPNGELIYNDAFLVFRALCKLSMKDIPPDNNDEQSIDVLSKVLSLELLFNIVDTAVPFFKHNERFIDDAIRKYLCFSILTNGLSPIRKVFRLSMSIFLALVFNFKEYLKAEIEVIFEKIILRILESSSSTQFQKRMVIQVLHKICKKPQLLCDIFLNYDCDPGGKNIFESMVKDLSKIAQSEPLNSDPEKNEVGTKTLALEVIVSVLRSLVDWSAELYEPPEDASSTSESESSDREETEIGDTSINALLKAHTPDKFEQQKQLKLLLERGKEIFRLHPKKGVKFFIQAGLCGSTPAEVAAFFRQTPGLDRTKMGEYFGERDPFCISVLHSFVDSMNFRGMEIDAALRKFLYDFRLPGEGQKIDRIIEKFAERYYAQNPNSYFATADVAYMVAFGLVLLNTDLHHPENKDKMSVAKWKESLRNLSEAMKTFDDAYLDVLYERIAKEQIRFIDDDERFDVINRNISAINNPKNRQAMFAQQTQQLIKKTQEQIKEKSKLKSQFFKASSITYVKPMFQVSWHPILISFGLILDETEDLKIVSLCLEGFKLAIRIAGMFYMDLELDAFVTTLAKFTHLESLSEIKPKNIECIHTLIEIALTEGNNLRNSWKSVLNRISQLERLHILGSGGKIDDSMGNNQPSDATTTISPLKNLPTTAKRATNFSNFEVVNAPTVASQIKTSTIDRIFTNSAKLNNNAILDFVVSLCAVSKDELSLANPRIFSLQKLVEIAHFNMNNRIRIVWLKIWKVLAEHFTFAGCHDNKRVAMYAIDSLRQLSVKFLEKEELANYNFQKEFLKPFEVVSKTDSRDIRELVAQCLGQMIKSRATAIKSGWKNILTVITTAAFDSDDSIVKLCWEIVEHIHDNCFQMLIEQGVFREYVQSLAAYATSARQVDIASKAIQALHTCAEFLASGKIQAQKVWKHKDESESNTTDETETKEFVSPTNAESSNSPQLTTTDTSSESVLNETAPQNELESNYQKQKQKKRQAKVKLINKDTANEKKALHTLWFALLSGLTGALHHSQLDVKNTAIEMLFKTLNTCGQNFDTELWEMIFRRVIIPAFGNAFPPSNQPLTQAEEEWWAGTGLKTLHNTVLVFSSFFNKVSFLLDSLLELFVSCILQGNETLATSGATCFELLLATCGDKFTEEQWGHVTQVIASTLRKQAPVEFDVTITETSVTAPNVTENPNSMSASVSQSSGNAPTNTVATERHSIDKGKEAIQSNVSAASRTSTEKKDGDSTGPQLLKKSSDIRLNIDKLRQSQQEQPDTKASQAHGTTISKQNETMKNLAGRIRVQNLLITIIIKERILDNDACLAKLTAEQIITILDALFDSYEFALKYLTSSTLREFLDNSVLDLFLKQETVAISSYFQPLFKFYSLPQSDTVRGQIAETRLLQDLKRVCGKYLDFLKEKKTSSEKLSVKAQRVINAQVVIVKNLLTAIANWNDALFARHLAPLFELFVSLVPSDSDEVREILCMLLTRIGRLKFHALDKQSVGQ